MSSITFTPEELAVFVQLVAGFQPGEGEVRTLVSVSRMFAASSTKDSDRTGAVLGILDTPMTPDAVKAFRTSFAQARAAGVRGE